MSHKSLQELKPRQLRNRLNNAFRNRNENKEQIPNQSNIPDNHVRPLSMDHVQ